jgi:hypothetical protein
MTAGLVKEPEPIRIQRSTDGDFVVVQRRWSPKLGVGKADRFWCGLASGICPGNTWSGSIGDAARYATVQEAAAALARWPGGNP